MISPSKLSCLFTTLSRGLTYSTINSATTLELLGFFYWQFVFRGLILRGQLFTRYDIFNTYHILICMQMLLYTTTMVGLQILACIFVLCVALCFTCSQPSSEPCCRRKNSSEAHPLSFLILNSEFEFISWA